MIKAMGFVLGLLLLTGLALAQPGIAVHPASHDFGVVRIGMYGPLTVWVTNTGTQDLQLHASCAGTGFELWEIPPWTIAPQDSLPLAVRFVPQIEAIFTGTLDLRSNSPVDSHVVVALTGTGSLTGGDPFEFDLLLPADSIMAAGDSLHLLWRDLHEVQPYIYRITVQPPGGAAQTFWAGSDTSYALALSALSGEGWFTWWVDMLYGFDELRSVSVRHFYFSTVLPTEFHLLSPADQSEFYEADPFVQEFRWENAAPHIAGVGYELWIVSSDSSSGPVYQTFATEDTFYLVDFTSGFPSHTPLWWFVVAYIEFDTMRSVEQWQFVLRTAGAEEPVTPLPERLAITSVYPNPFNPETRITLAVPQTGRVRADVYDLLGRHVSTLLDGPLSAGTHTLAWQAPGATGIYFLRVSDARGSASVRKLHVVR